MSQKRSFMRQNLRKAVNLMEHRPLAIKAMRVIDRGIRRVFPEDAGKRCMYGAYALAALLRDAQYPAIIVGGDFLVFTPSRDGQSAGLQGFGGSTTVGTASHYWVESEKRLVDPSPMMLPPTTSTQIVKPPAIYWPLDTPFPRYLRYVAKMRVSPDAVFSRVPEQCSKAEAIVEEFRQQMQETRTSMITKLSVLD